MKNNSSADLWRGTSCLVLLCLALLLPCCACSNPAGGPPTPVPPARHNVLLVLLDTTRVDRLGCYGGSGGMTPRLDSFAAGAVRFDQAFSHAPWTLPSAVSIYTSQYPAQHGAGRVSGEFTTLGQEAVTLAELFRETGYATGAVVNVIFLTERFGTAQGFDTVIGRHSEDNRLAGQAGRTTDSALKWLDGLGEQPFFLLVHYFDPHLTYDPPSPFRERFADPRDTSEKELFGTRDDVIDFRRGALKLNRSDIARLEKRHNGEVAYMDSELGRLLDGLAARGLDEDTTVAITADHGEEFLDHGGFEHGHTFYDELLHVPLIIRTPGAAAGLAVPSTVRHIDLAPTLCELSGIESHHGFAGVSLLDRLHGHPGRDLPVLSQGNMWGPGGVAWRRDGYKLIRRHAKSPFQLFEMAADPGEKHDLASADPERTGRMIKDLGRASLDLVKSSSGEDPQLTEEEARRLRALGYLD